MEFEGSSLTLNLDFIKKINDFLNTNDGNYLEIGVYYGITLCQIAEKHPSKKFYGIDPFIADGNTGQEKGVFLTDQEKYCKKNVEKLSNISLFQMTSNKFYEQLNDNKVQEMNISVVYIDGSHHFDDVKIDIDLAVKLIGNKKGMVIFDDLWMEGVKLAVRRAMKKYPQHFLSPIYYLNY